jgi:hypothetical protein
MKRNSWLYMIFLHILITLPRAWSSAQGTLPPPSGCGCAPGTFCNPLRFCNIKDFLAAVLDAIITIAFPIIVLAIIYTGFLFVTARGDSGKLETAKKALVFTVLGAMLILGAFVFSNTIKSTIEQLRAGSEPAAELTSLP